MSEELKQKALERIKIVDFAGQFFLEMFIGGGWAQASKLMEREVAEAYKQRWAEFASQVCEQAEKERDDCVMLLKAVIAKNGDLQCLREKIVDYLQRKGLTSVLR